MSKETTCKGDITWVIYLRFTVIDAALEVRVPLVVYAKATV